MTEDLMLTAHFVINPFTSVHGTYAGLLTSTEFGGGGFLSGKVTRQGAFSLKAILGKLTLPIKGRFSLEGQFSGRVVVKGTSYQVDLTLNVTGDGARTITGSIVGGNRSATLAADLSPFQRRSAPVSANLAGTFNCLLPANPNVADPNYPIGLGFARFTVLPSGMAKFSGRIADGSAVSGGAPLSGEGRLPFFSSLYGGGGSISGWMDFDPGQIDHDVSGTLNWSKPRSSRRVVHSEGFSGQSDLFGARIATIASFLNSPRQLTLTSPAKDPNPLNVSIPFTFSRNGQTTVSIPSGIPIESIALKVRPKSGLFSGRVVERNAIRKINGMIVGSKLNRAGGFVLRNGYSTALEIEPGVVE